MAGYLLEYVYSDSLSSSEKEDPTTYIISGLAHYVKTTLIVNSIIKHALFLPHYCLPLLRRILKSSSPESIPYDRRCRSFRSRSRRRRKLRYGRSSRTSCAIASRRGRHFSLHYLLTDINEYDVSSLSDYQSSQVRKPIYRLRKCRDRFIFQHQSSACGSHGCAGLTKEDRG